MKSAAFAAVLPTFFVAALAQAADAGTAAVDAGTAEAGAARSAGIGRSCVERLPLGKERPQVRESFPARGTSGYASTLEIVVEHGKGETVLPTGLDLRQGGAEDSELKSAGFALPDPEGGAGPSCAWKTAVSARRARCASASCCCRPSRAASA